MSSSVHISNKYKDILVFGKRPTEGLDITTLTAEAKYSLTFAESRKRFVLSLQNKGSNSFLFVNTTKNISIQNQKLRSKTICSAFG